MNATARSPSAPPDAAARVALPRENIHGHLERVRWFRQHVEPQERAIEFGCGTGYMITYPMRVAGYDLIGVDLDRRSVEYGRSLLEQAGLDPGVLLACDFAEVPGEFDAVIASEILEHLDDADLAASLKLIRAKLRPGGRLLVTVPNGYGWYEFESFVWSKLHLDRLVEFARTQLAGLRRARWRMAGGPVDVLPSTLADSPHVRRFTLRSLRRTLEDAGFEVIDTRGSVLVSGPLTHLLFSGSPALIRLNARLGRRLTPVASGFYVAARP